ncbi:MAG: carbohydrate porin [Thermoguttaceae bacterium]
MLILIAAAFQSAALGQPEGAFLSQGVPPGATVLYPPPANGAGIPMLAQNVTVQGADAAQPSEGPPAPKPAEKKEDEKAEKSDKKEDGEGQSKPEQFNAYGQATVLSQWHGPFPSPYQGTNSFLPIHEWDTSETSTLFLGGRIWPGGELYFNPEVAGGLGLSDVFGISAFPNGEITRVGKPEATPYIARLWAQQTIGLGGEQEKLESAPNQLGETKDVSRITLAVGKMAATDWFDNNRYSHDPRSQFMNWDLMYDGAWDYPADVRGYTFGAVTELNQKSWAFRYGIFGEPLVANGPIIDPHWGKAHGQAVELEYRYTFFDRPGKIRGMFSWNRADMGNYRDAIALGLAMGATPDITQTRTYQSVKYGLCMNIEQELSDDFGAFLRLGWNDGRTETWAFTETDRTVAFGFVLKGSAWRRKEDVIGTGLVVNGLSGPHADYLAAGGLGFELGDGRLNYEPEFAWETYYCWQVLKKSIWITPDFQFIGNPGYNGDRGPVAIGSVRVHAEF